MGPSKQQLPAPSQLSPGQHTPLQQPSLAVQHVSPQQLAQQTPLQHTSPLGQASPHVPQCAGSFWTSIHTPSQQASPAAQALPHAPQFCASVCTSVQTSSQQVSPLSHAPQASSPPQPSDGAPHCLGWHVAGVQQLPWKQTRPSAHVVTHVPDAQVRHSSAGHAMQVPAGPQIWHSPVGQLLHVRVPPHPSEISPHRPAQVPGVQQPSMPAQT
jgi:hypothetical protein